MKKARLGEDPLSWVQNTTQKKQHTSKTVKQHDSTTAKQQTVKPSKRTQTVRPAFNQLPIPQLQPAAPTAEKVKATYYMPPELLKKLKFIGVEKDRDLSDLVTEAVGDLINKYVGNRK